MTNGKHTPYTIHGDPKHTTEECAACEFERVKNSGDWAQECYEEETEKRYAAQEQLRLEQESGAKQYEKRREIEKKLASHMSQCPDDGLRTAAMALIDAQTKGTEADYIAAFDSLRAAL